MTPNQPNHFKMIMSPRGIHSIYRWEGDLAEDPEALLLVKTTGERYPELEARIRAMHPYEVPEIIALPFDRALPEFQSWLFSATALREG